MDEGEGEGEAEEEIPKADMMVAAMLLASVTYMMFTLGMANQRKDRALKKLTWTALHTKISIFCAVLMYQAVTGLFVLHEHEDGTLRKIISAGFGWFFWFLMLQMLMASLSFEMFSKVIWQRKEEKQEDWEERREVLMEFWGVLMGHITGFASIVFWAQSQLGWQQPSYTPGAFLIFLVAIPLQILWFVLVKWVRHWVVKTYDPNAQDGHASKEARKALATWEEKTEETENDSVALTVSFMLAQAFRVLVSGVMPDPEGFEPRHGPAETGPLIHTHTLFECVQLLFWGILIFSMVIAWRDWKLLACIKDPLEECCDKLRLDFERMTEVASDIGSMTLAWILFFAMFWFLDTLNQDVCQSFGSGQGGDLNCGSGGMTGGILLAMFCTIFSYSTIFAFRRTALHIDDFASSTHHQQKTAHDIILSVMKAQGLLIGFGWEKAFDHAVEDLSERARHPALTRFFMSFVVFAMVGYVWMWYILPTVMVFVEDDETKNDLKKQFKQRAYKNQSDQSLLGEENKRIAKATEEFDKELARIQREFDEAKQKTDKHFKSLMSRRYDEQKDSNGRIINSGKSRADHLNHLRHMLLLQKEVADYKITGGDLFRTNTQNPDPASETHQTRAAASPYLKQAP